MTSEHNDMFTRAHTRIATQGIDCATDPNSTPPKVADLTSHGMRISIPTKSAPNLDDELTFTFSGPDTHNTLTITGVVRWMRKPSSLSRKVDIGIEFTNLKPHYRDALTRLAIHGDLVLSTDPNPNTDSNTNESTQTHSTPPKQPTTIDLYQILAVSPYATQEQITRAFRQLVKVWHPDRNDAPDAAHHFEQLHKAYSVLRDPKLRARYDERYQTDQDNRSVA